MKIQKTIHQNLLKVTITVPKAEYITDKKIKITTDNVIKIVNDEGEYKILSMLKEGMTIKNFIKNKTDTNQSTWVFLVSKRVVEQKKPPPSKKTPRTRKKTGPKPSIRGRMNKIAKEIEISKSEEE